MIFSVSSIRTFKFYFNAIPALRLKYKNILFYFLVSHIRMNSKVL